MMAARTDDCCESLKRPSGVNSAYSCIALRQFGASKPHQSP